MSTIPNQENFLNNLRQFFLEKGFSEKEFEFQMEELGKLISTSAFGRLLKQKPPIDKLSSEEETIDYLKNNFSQEEISKALEEESKIIAQKYLKELKI